MRTINFELFSFIYHRVNEWDLAKLFFELSDEVIDQKNVLGGIYRELIVLSFHFFAKGTLSSILKSFCFSFLKYPKIIKACMQYPAIL